MTFNRVLDIRLNEADLALTFGISIFYPEKVEKRYLNDVRHSLLDSEAKGPDVLYSIAMDVGKKEHTKDLIDRNLLYGVVAYNAGLIGSELVRSQGHVHAISPSCHSSTPEVYEIWQGEAYIYMQEFASERPGRCFAILAKPGDIVIVPPNWAHYTVNASPHQKMLFGAWCIRDYAFEYHQIRARQGLAYYPVVTKGEINWIENPNYLHEGIEVKQAREYQELGLSNENLYMQYEENPSRFEFVTDPLNYQSLWDDFQP